MAASRLSVHSNVGLISPVLPDEHSGCMQCADTTEGSTCISLWHSLDRFHLGVYLLSQQWRLASV